MNRFLAILSSMFAVLSGVSQTFVLEPPVLRYATFGATFICAFVAFIFFRKSSCYESAILALQGLSNTSNELCVTVAVSEAEVREVWRLDVANFNDHQIPLSVGVAWWRKYSNGLYLLKRDGDILGYISFWPLSERTFNAFVSGHLLENTITSRNIFPPSATAQITWWYIGSIALLIRLRKTKAVGQLIFNAVNDWTSKLNPASTVNVCALAYSKEGEKLLKRFGFNCFEIAKNSPHNLPVYIYKANVNELKQRLSQVFQHVR